MTFKGFSKLLARRLRNNIQEIKIQHNSARYYAKKALNILNRPENIPEVSKTPRQVTVENCSICNLDCIMCQPGLSKRKKGMIEEDIFCHTLMQFKNLGLKYTEFHTINEPLLHPKLDRLLEISRKLNINVGISTNGLLIKKRMEILNKYSDILGICVSIDGCTRETYNKVRKGGEFYDLLKNIDALMKCEIVKTHGKLPSISVALSKMNISEAGLFFDTFKQIKPHNVNFSFVNNLAAVNDFYEIAGFSFYDQYKSKVPCSLPFNYLWVLNDGKVTACCRDYHESLVVGHVEKNTLLEIWNSEEIKKIRKAHSSGDLSDYQVCKNCKRLNKGISGFVDAYLHFLYYLKLDSGRTNEKIMDCIQSLEERSMDKIIDILQSY